MPTPQQPSGERYSHTTPTQFTLNGVRLQFWIRKDTQLRVVQLMVKKEGDRRTQSTCECYPVVTILDSGECYRNSGLPTDWGFKLVEGRRIKEIR